MNRPHDEAPAETLTQPVRPLCADCGLEIKGKVRRKRCENCYRAHLKTHGRLAPAIPREADPVKGAVEHAKRTPDGCWLFTGRLDEHGYGVMTGVGQKRAHRAVYQALVGEIPDGMDLDHLCHTPEACAGGPGCLHRRCINPEHLSPKTRRDNWLRGSSMTARNLAKTHCAHGHEFTPENTAIRKGSDGRTRRRCRACHRAEHAQKAR